MSERNGYMRNVLGLCVGILITTGLLIGCGGGGGGGGNPVAPAANQQLADLRGTVTFNGTPVADAAVYLVKPENALNSGLSQAQTTGNVFASGDVKPTLKANAGFGDYRTTTDQKGGYVFSQIPVGEYTLYAIKDNEHQFVQTNVVLGAITVLDAQLTPTGALTGTVSVPAGLDAAGTWVYLQGTSFVAFTGIDGSYTLSNVPAGTYTLAAQRPGYRVVTTSITVAAGVSTTVPAISLDTSTFGSLAGRVIKTAPVDGEIDSDLLPLRLASDAFELYAVPDTNGNFVFKGVLPGDYLLTTTDSEYRLASSAVPPFAVTVTVAANTNTNLGTFGLVPRPGIGGLGRIAGTLPAGVVPGMLELRGNNQYFTAPVDPVTRNFVFRQVPAGSYVISTLKGGSIFFNSPGASYTVALAANANLDIPAASFPVLMQLAVAAAPTFSGDNVLVTISGSGTLSLAGFSIGIDQNGLVTFLPTSGASPLSGNLFGIRPGVGTILVRHNQTGVEARWSNASTIPPLAPQSSTIFIQPGRGTSYLSFRPVPWVEDYRINLYSPTSPTLVASFVTNVTANIALTTPGGKQFVVGIVSRTQNGSQLSNEVLSSPFQTPNTFPASTSYILPITPEAFVDIVTYNGRLFLQQNEAGTGSCILYQRNLTTGAAQQMAIGPTFSIIVNPQIVAGRDYVYGVYSQTGTSFVQRYSQTNITVNAAAPSNGQDRIKAAFNHADNSLYLLSGRISGPYNVRIDKYVSDLSSNVLFKSITSAVTSFNNAQCALGPSQDGSLLAYWYAPNTSTLEFAVLDTVSSAYVGTYTYFGSYDMYAQDGFICDQNNRFGLSIRDSMSTSFQYVAVPTYRDLVSPPYWVPPITGPTDFVRSWAIDKHDRIWVLANIGALNSVLRVYNSAGSRIAEIDLPEPLLSTNPMKNLAYDPITEKVAVILDAPPSGMRVYIFDAAM